MSCSILLNILPPFSLNSPSLSYSSLKACLERESVMVDVCYWNLSLNTTIKHFCDLGSLMEKTPFYRTLPAKALQAIWEEDKEAMRDIRYLVLSLKPEYRMKGRLFTEERIRSGVADLVSVIDREIDRMDVGKYNLIAFQHNPVQEVWEIIIRKRIEERYPHVTVVTGIEGSPQQACNKLLQTIGRTSNCGDTDNEPYPDFSDYLLQVKSNVPKEEIALPVEQDKSVEHIISEIEYQTAATGIYRILLTGSNLSPTKTEQIADFCIAFRHRYPQFRVTTDHLSIRGITLDCIKKLALAGLRCMYAEYDRVVDNLFFLKWAHTVKLPILPLPITIPMETDDDLYKITDSLYYYRFILNNTPYYHPYAIPYLEEEDPDEIGTEIFRNTIWKRFKNIKQYYCNTNYHYTVYPHAGGFLYMEQVGEREIFRLDVKKESIEYGILHETNQQIRTLNELLTLIPGCTEEELRKVIGMLRERGLVYATEDMTEIVSVIALKK